MWKCARWRVRALSAFCIGVTSTRSPLQAELSMKDWEKRASRCGTKIDALCAFLFIPRCQVQCVNHHRRIMTSARCLRVLAKAFSILHPANLWSEAFELRPEIVFPMESFESEQLINLPTLIAFRKVRVERFFGDLRRLSLALYPLSIRFSLNAETRYRFS